MRTIPASGLNIIIVPGSFSAKRLYWKSLCGAVKPCDTFQLFSSNTRPSHWGYITNMTKKKAKEKKGKGHSGNIIILQHGLVLMLHDAIIYYTCN